MLTADDPAPGAALDLRLVPAACAAWACAGWAVAAPSAAAVQLAAGAGAGAAVLVALAVAFRAVRGGLGPPPLERAATVLAVLAGTVAAVAVTTAAATGVRHAGVLPGLVDDGATASVRATVTSPARPVRPDPARPWTLHGHPRWVVDVRAREVSGRGLRSRVDAPVLVVGRASWARVERGQRVRVVGRLGATDAGSDAVAVVSTQRPPAHDGAGGLGQRVLVELRTGLVRSCARLPRDARGLVPGLVVGDTRDLPADLSAAMRTAGLTHLTAVSGGNTALVTGSALLAAALLGAGRAVRVVVAGAALVLFTTLAGTGPSVLRAAATAVLGLLALASSRRGSGAPALSAAVVALLLGDPWLSRSAGFALSVLATGALVLLAPAWSRVLARWLPRPAAAALAVPLAAQAVCAPVVVLLAPRVSLVAVPANLLADPVVGPATVLGLGATLLDPVWPAGAAVLARVAGLGATWIAGVARTAAALPGAAVPWPPGWPGALALAAATAAAAVAVPALLGTVVRAARRRVARGAGRVRARGRVVG